MSTPVIDVYSRVGKAVAKALNITPEKFDEVDGKKDGQFCIHWYGSEKVSDEIAKLRKQIISPNDRWNWNFCENVFFIDNGDGKISAGDLFLRADGYFQEKTSKGHFDYSYRTAWLFAPREVQSKSGYDARESSKITPEEDKMLKNVEALKGKTYASPEVKKLFKSECSTRNPY